MSSQLKYFVSFIACLFNKLAVYYTYKNQTKQNKKLIGVHIILA